MNVDVRLEYREESGRAWPVLCWRCGPGWRMVASTVVGGGIGSRRWWLNATVPAEYHHADPAAHVGEIAAGLGLLPHPGGVAAAGDDGLAPAAGVGMLTAADVARFTEAADGDVRVVATVGLGLPVWAAAAPATIAAETAGLPAPDGPHPRIGTINLLAVVPAPLSDAALVNAVVTMTEAKSQALVEAGVPGTGTSSDAVCLACPEVGVPVPSGWLAHGAARGTVLTPEPYAGPRSTWGARLARAVHAAVLEGSTRPAR